MEMERSAWTGRRFVGLMFAFVAVALPCAFLTAVWPGSFHVLRVVTLLIGVTILIYPFSTPETVAMLGMRRARTAARISGAVVLATGIFLFVHQP